jgi:hypothetical protein
MQNRLKKWCNSGSALEKKSQLPWFYWVLQFDIEWAGWFLPTQFHSTGVRCPCLQAAEIPKSKSGSRIHYFKDLVRTGEWQRRPPPPIEGHFHERNTRKTINTLSCNQGLLIIKGKSGTPCHIFSVACDRVVLWILAIPGHSIFQLIKTLTSLTIPKSQFKHAMIISIKTALSPPQGESVQPDFSTVNG